MGALTKIFGTHSERELKRIYPLVDKVESYRDSMQKLSDEELRNKTKEYKERLEKGETLDDLLPEAFATVREAAKRVLGFIAGTKRRERMHRKRSTITPWMRCGTLPWI